MALTHSHFVGHLEVLYDRHKGWSFGRSLVNKYPSVARLKGVLGVIGLDRVRSDLKLTWIVMYRFTGESVVRLRSRAAAAGLCPGRHRVPPISSIHRVRNLLVAS